MPALRHMHITDVLITNVRSLGVSFQCDIDLMLLSRQINNIGRVDLHRVIQNVFT